MFRSCAIRLLWLSTAKKAMRAAAPEFLEKLIPIFSWPADYEAMANCQQTRRFCSVEGRMTVVRAPPRSQSACLPRCRRALQTRTATTGPR